MPLSVLLLDGHSPFALAVVQCLGASQHARVHVLSRRRHVPVAASRHVASVGICDSADDDEFVEHALSAARRTGATVCLAVDEPTIQLVARNSERLCDRWLHAPVPHVNNLRVASDKWLLAAFLQAQGLPHPRTVLCTNDLEITRESWARSCSVLLKPRTGSNGIGIKRFRDVGALTAHLAQCPEASHLNIVQEFVVGSDIDCSVLCVRGQVVAHTIQRSLCSDSGRFSPAGRIEFVEDSQVLAVVSRLMSALDWHGVAHIDLRYNVPEQRVEIIEINPRFWGSLLGSLRAGVNFPYLACLAGLGFPVAPSRARPCRYVAGRTALSYWCRGRFASGSTGFRPSETAFLDIWRDPWPYLVEVVQPYWGGAHELRRAVAAQLEPRRARYGLFAARPAEPTVATPPK